MEQCILNGSAQDKAEPKPVSWLASPAGHWKNEVFHFLSALSDLLGQSRMRRTPQ
jgi:hypothetical protein